MMEPVFNKNYNCLDTTLANAARFYKRDHEMMFLGAWGFKFSEDHTLPMEKRLKTDWQSTKEYLSIFHGVQEESSVISDQKLQKELIFAELQNNKAVAVKIDAYTCQWNLAYGQYHIPHFCLIIGRTNEEFICIDTYSSEKEERLSVDTAFNAIYTFQVKDVTNGMIVSRAQNLLGSKNFFQRISIQNKMILNFADNLENIDYEYIAALAKEVWASPLCRKIKEIGCGRKNFLLSITYLENISNNLDMIDIKAKMTDITLNWVKIYRLFIKACFLRERESILSKIHELLSFVAYAETNLAEQMANIFSLGGANEK